MKAKIYWIALLHVVSIYSCKTKEAELENNRHRYIVSEEFDSEVDGLKTQSNYSISYNGSGDVAGTNYMRSDTAQYYWVNITYLTSYEYGSNGYLVKQTHTFNNSTRRDILISLNTGFKFDYFYTYDDNDRLIQRIRKGFGTTNGTVTSNGTETVKFTYDKAGKLASCSVVVLAPFGEPVLTRIQAAWRYSTGVINFNAW